MSDNLNPQQFTSIWDEKTPEMRETAGRFPAEGRMPLAEAREKIDPVFRPWEKFHASERGYIGNLADHVKREGVINPIVLDERDKIYDGHHRLAAAEIAGHADIPWRRIQRPVNPYEA